MSYPPIISILILLITIWAEVNSVLGETLICVHFENPVLRELLAKEASKVEGVRCLQVVEASYIDRLKQKHYNLFLWCYRATKVSCFIHMVETLITHRSEVDDREIPDLFLPEWKKDGFDVLEEIGKTRGPFIEIGGPTPKGYGLVDTKKLPKRLNVSNVVPEGVDFVADLKALPFRDESLGAIFASCLPRDLGSQAAEEVWRVLEKGGIFVWQKCGYWGIEHSEIRGFQLLEYKRHDEEVYGCDYFFCDTIFQKTR